MNCTGLERLTLKNLESLSKEAIESLFTNITVIYLEKINLHRLVQTGDESILKIIQRCATKLLALDINGLDELTELSLMELQKFTMLKTLDVSFIRNFTDGCIVPLMKKSIQSVKLFGVHKLTDTLLNDTWKNGRGETIKLVGNEFD